MGYLPEIKVPVNAIINVKTEYNQKLCSRDSEISSEVIHIQVRVLNVWWQWNLLDTVLLCLNLLKYLAFLNNFIEQLVK